MARATKYPEHKGIVVRLIDAAARHHGRPPTVRHLADQVGVGVATMHSYLNKMAEEGLVQWRPKQHRSLSITPEAFPLLSQPDQQSP